MDITIFQSVGEAIEEAIHIYIDPAASSLISGLRVTATVGVGLYFTLTGYLIMTGAVQESFYTLLKQSTKVIIIAAFALNADVYSNWVVEAFRGLESGLATLMSTKDIGQDASIYKILDTSVNRILDIAAQCMESAKDSGLLSIGSAIGWVAAAFLIGGCAIAFTVLGGATIIAAKFSLAIMFALGPLFIMCLMWPVTARFFDAWFSQVMNYILTIVIMVVVMAFAKGQIL